MKRATWQAIAGDRARGGTAAHRRRQARAALEHYQVVPLHRHHYLPWATGSLPQSSKTSGRPIDFAMGDENLAQTDFVVDGPGALTIWSRLYRSSLSAYDHSPLGRVGAVRFMSRSK